MQVERQGLLGKRAICNVIVRESNAHNYTHKRVSLFHIEERESLYSVDEWN